MPAVTSVTNFSDGNVLTATALNAVNCGIHVYSNAAARDAAYGGSGERTLVEGEYAYLLDTDQTLVYSGTSWITVGVTPGLVCVKAETAFSAVASFTADSVFTSTYTNYRIIVRYQTSTTQELAMQLRAATVDTATGYNFQMLQATSTTVSGQLFASQTSAFVGKDPTTFTSLTTLELSGPQLAEPTVYQAVNTRNASAYTNPFVVQYFGNQSSSTQFDGIKFLVASGTTTGSYTIYGYSKAV
jgi:hypothetical protein